MPFYDYRCQQCRAKTTVFTRSVSASVQPTCSQCGSTELQRLVSTFAYHKSVQTVHEESGPPSASPGMDYYKDPRNIGRHVEDFFQKQGMELPQQVQEKIKAAREGVMPKELDL
ncbi:MAG: zinc ribbon domain-containing protein [Chloroflexi bacterium]|nr:zinc ribbon domain-containing protein [Chloroflexota bacterium]